jgi:predicted small lipoprotein YifL
MRAQPHSPGMPLRLLAASAVLALLAACGQKGALYLPRKGNVVTKPAPGAPATTPAATPKSSAPDDGNDDDQDQDNAPPK